MLSFRVVACLAICLVFGGCADLMKDGAGDPLEPVNRVMFDINEKLDRNTALPAAVFYRATVPSGIRNSVHNVLSNIGLPVTFANDVLQGEVRRAGDTASRFGINTTMGILGVRDPATDMGYPIQQEDFGQTLGVYGVPGGPYVVLPLLGAALPRDVIGRIFVDHYFSPLGYLDYSGKYYVSIAERIFSTVDGRARAIKRLSEIERSSVDHYTAMRDAYLQRRDDQIHNRDSPDPDLSAN